MTIYPTLLVEAPPIQPYKYGLASVAVPADTSDGHWRLGVEYEPISSYEPGVLPGTCYEGVSPTVSLPSGVGTNVSLPYSAYAGVSCSIVGYTEEKILARARAILKLGWQHAAESALWTGAAGNLPALSQAGSVLASGGSIVDGLATLESYLGSNYTGVGVIHVPRLGAPYLADRHQIFERGVNQLQTALGSQFVFGGGYPNTAPGGGAAGAGNLWMYATGLITIRMDEAFINGGLAQALNRATNVQTVFAEQPTVLTIDGPIVAVRVDLTK